ncbi:unnamed protein product [Leuciscus chuanchicus]
MDTFMGSGERKEERDRRGRNGPGQCRPAALVRRTPQIAVYRITSNPGNELLPESIPSSWQPDRPCSHRAQLAGFDVAPPPFLTSLIAVRTAHCLKRTILILRKAPELCQSSDLGLIVIQAQNLDVLEETAGVFSAGGACMLMNKTGAYQFS